MKSKSTLCLCFFLLLLVSSIKLCAQEEGLITKHILSQRFFSNQKGTYSVDSILKWANENKHLCRRIDLQPLLGVIIRDTWGDDEREVQQSNFQRLMRDEQHRKRAMEADLSLPIVLNNFHVIIDGVHRIFRAMYEGSNTISAVFIDQSLLEQFNISPQEAKAPSIVSNMPVDDITVCVDKGRLPIDEPSRRAIIENYFAEHLPTAIPFEDRWDIILERPSTPYGNFSYDESLRDGLRWWGEGTRIRDIDFERKFLSQRVLLALEDQWMPLSWSHYIQRLGSPPRELVLLHIDDHQDMMAPRIGRRLDGELVDFITGDTVSLMNPDSVTKAIKSGAIGKGSILTLLVWSVEKIHIRHLSRRPASSKYYHLERRLCEDKLLSKDRNKISIAFESASEETLPYSSNYLVTDDCQEWVKGIPADVPIFMHIDMDYFNDRFDGDSNWRDRKDRIYDPDLKEQQAMLDKMFQAMSKAELLHRIVDFNIGISAGFFPSEFWPPMVDALIEKLRQTKILVED